MRFHTISLISLVLLSSVAAVAATDSAPANATWQAHSASFFYNGRTSYYSCSGLEDKVKTILLHLGARKDAKVHASGCINGQSQPSPDAWVEASFHTVAADEHASGADAVQAQWTKFEISPYRPYEMGTGECELMEYLKAAITGSFALRDLRYNTTCVPHQISMADYGVTGQVFRPATAAKK